MTTKILDSGSVERTVSQVKVLDVGNVVRTIAFIRVMGSDMVVREVFTAAGSGGGTAPSVSISPAYASYSGRKPPSRSGIFTVNTPSGSTVTSYHWGLRNGSGSVSGSATGASATLTIYGETGSTAEATFYCDVVIGGTTYTAECTLSFDYEG